jgi:hypothetical protein
MCDHSDTGAAEGADDKARNNANDCRKVDTPTEKLIRMMMRKR